MVRAAWMQYTQCNKWAYEGGTGWITEESIIFYVIVVNLD